HAAGTLAYRSVKSILEQQLDRLPLEEPTATRPLPAHHEHVRGPAYYETAGPEAIPEPLPALPRHLPLC
ncbi:MAG: hypothetical protein ACK5N1_01510, partial [Gemmatimonas sp.]